MGYYANWLENRWDPIDHNRVITAEQRQLIDRRKRLIDDLMVEIETSGDSIIKLYAGLLARTLTATDEVLIRACSERLANLTPKKTKSPQNAT
jgi:hypothetical protein